MSEKEPVVSSDLERIVAGIVRYLDEQYDLRELTLSLSRDIVRLSGQAILLIHRLDFDSAAKKIEEAKSKLDEIDGKIAKHPEFREKGFISSAFQEYTEACLLFYLLRDGKFISYEDLNVPCIPYLLGLGDLVGELRRHILDSIRREEVEKAEKLLYLMEDLYIQLVALDYPEALVSGLRHKCDIARSLVEKTRGDITLALQNRKLIKKMQSLSELLGGKSDEI